MTAVSMQGLIICIAASFFFTCGYTFASDVELDARISLTPFFVMERGMDSDLFNGADRSEFGVSIKPQLMATYDDKWGGFIQGQFFIATDEVMIDSDEGSGEADLFASLRQMWIEYGGFSPYANESIRLGRDRIRYHDGIWIDDDIVSVRWVHQSSLIDATFGVAEKISDFRTNNPLLSEREDNVSRLFGHMRRQIAYGHFYGLRFLYSHGRNQSTNKQRLISGALSLDNGYYLPYSLRRWDYVAAILMTTGKTLESEQYEITSGMALDVGLRWNHFIDTKKFSIGSHYTTAPYGSHGGYLPSGLESYRASYTGTRSKFHRFNEAFRAELFNIHISTLYLSLEQNAEWDINFALQRFEIDSLDAGVIAFDIQSNDLIIAEELGYGADITGSWYWGEGSNYKPLPVFLRNSYLRMRTSFFMSGDGLEGLAIENKRVRILFDWVRQL